MAELIIAPPGRRAPGFLRRLRRGMHIMAAMRTESLTAEVMDELVDFLLPYVVDPADRVEAAEALWEASQEQIELAMAAISGNTDPLSEPESATA